MTYIFDFATKNDFDFCEKIVKSKLSSSYSEEEYKAITEEIMKTAFKMGGGYHYTIISTLALLYETKDN